MISQINLKLQRTRLLATTVCVLLATFLFFFFTRFEIKSRSPIQEEALVFSPLAPNPDLPNSLTTFNPNDLDKDQWIKLGFSERQTETLLKYKKMLGGSFTSKAQFQKCYAVSEEMFRALEPYLLLPDSKETVYSSGNSNHYVKKGLQIKGKFNPDHYQLDDWHAMGFSERQAAAILKYKNYLGGSFISKEKFKACFIISEENYRKLAPYLLLPEKGGEASTFKQKSFSTHDTKSGMQYKSFDPNSLSFEGWKALGFSEKQTQVILNYKERILKGSFKTTDDLKNCFVISEGKFKELLPYIRLQTTSQIAEPRTSAGAAVQESTDFSKIDLNKITFKQLKEYGFEDRAAASYLGFRKKLGGFVEKKQILETYNLDPELAKKLVNEAFLNIDHVEKYSLIDAPEDWLKNHPYFKYYADRIIFYRISYPEDKKVFKKINVKPETEAKMRLYLL